MRAKYDLVTFFASFREFDGPSFALLYGVRSHGRWRTLMPSQRRWQSLAMPYLWRRNLHWLTVKHFLKMLTTAMYADSFSELSQDVDVLLENRSRYIYYIAYIYSIHLYICEILYIYIS